MTAHSNANTSGLEVVAWTGSGSLSRIKGKDFRFQGYIYGTEDEAHPIALVTAASAQARIDAAEARANTLAKALEPFAAEHECDGHATVEDFNMEVQIFVRWAVIKAARAALQQETQP